MLQNYAVQIKALPADRLEDFVNDWLHFRVRDYISHELWRGAGDMGRDVTGYATTRRMEGLWDNFQCKQLSKNLTEASAMVELGKIFMHVANGAFILPRAYTFVAPRGVGRSIQALIAHPEAFRQAFLDRWDNEIAQKLVENDVVPLRPEISAAIKAFDFEQIHWLDAAGLAADKYCKAALVKWFGDDPGRAPRGEVPVDVQGDESIYVGQLVRLYNAKGPGAYADAVAVMGSEHGEHLRHQRTRFFDAIAYERFYRDSTPEEYLLTFQDEIFFGIVDVYGEAHADGLTRVGQVMKQAAVLRPSGVLGRHAGPQVQQGACHQFANEGRLKWHP